MPEGMAQNKCKVAVLISGSGTNLQALIDAATEDTAFSVCAVISNRPEAYGLTRAGEAGIPVAVINQRDYPDRQSLDRALSAEIDKHNPDLVVLAGFMRILTAEFVHRYSGRLLNIHPSLLPKYRGLDTHQRALEAGEVEHGATVHFVTEELDGGPAIVQAVTPIVAGDTAEQLARRVQVQEHFIYPLAVSWFARGRLRMVEDHAELDGKLLPRGGKRVSR